MTNEQKTIIKSYVGSWAGYYVKLLCDKGEFLKQPDELPDSFEYKQTSARGYWYTSSRNC